MDKCLKVDEYWSELLRLSEEALQQNCQLMSQNEINIPLQARENPSLMSNGVASVDSILCSSGSAFFQSEKSEAPNTTTCEKINKKKIADKAYRTRLKERKRKLEDDLNELREENKILKYENDSLKKDKDAMNNALELANAETKQARSEMCKLKEKMTVQKVLVETFSHKVIKDDEQQEIERLNNKIFEFSQYTKWEDWMTEKEELLKVIASLDHQNKMLQVQVDALCWKIKNPNEIDDVERL